MDGCETRDCIVYDGNRVGVSLTRPKEYYIKRALALAITTLALMLVGAVIGIACLRGDILRTLQGQTGGGSQNEGVADDVDETSEENRGGFPDEEDPDGNEDDGDGSKEEDDETAGENESAPPPDSAPLLPASKDMSFSERGDAYIVNYSKLNPDAKGILEMGFGGGRYTYSEAPVVLILHTHTSEGYLDADGNDPFYLLNHSVLTVGERITYELSRRGIPTVHCSVIHDGDGEDAYANAADTIATMLKIYPTIEYVIDLHRAEEQDEDGNPLKSESATGDSQIRITVSSGGGLSEESLALALCLRRELNSGEARLCMPVVFTDSKYNSDLSKYYLKVEVGTQANETAESVAAGEAFAAALADILKK